jgi:hypothetical protein
MSATIASNASTGLKVYDHSMWYREPTHFTTPVPNFLEHLREIFVKCGVDVVEWNPDTYSGTLHYQTPGGIDSCDIKLKVLLDVDSSYILEFMRFKGCHFAFNRIYQTIYRRFQTIHRRFQGLPEEEEEEEPVSHHMGTALPETPLSSKDIDREWQMINRYLETTPMEGLSIITKLALQGASVPSNVLTAVLCLPQDTMTRPCIIALLGSNQDFTGLEADVKTWLAGFVSHVRDMGVRYDAIAPTVIPGANQLYLTEGEIDLQRYCQMLTSLRSELMRDDAGAMLPEVVEVLTFARDRTTWSTTVELALELLSRV